MSPHYRFISVPINKKGAEECEYRMDEGSSNVHEFEIPEELYLRFSDSETADKILNIDGVLFGDYESDHISADCIGKCLNILRESEFQNSIISGAFKDALNYGFGLYTDF